MFFTLQAGLVFRRGAQTLELIRELENGDWSIEDCLTRRPSTISTSKLINKLWKGQIHLVGTDKLDRKQGQEQILTPLISFDRLTEKHTKDLQRRLTYVTAIRKAHLTRGMRREIEKTIRTVAERTRDLSAPSSSTVMSWIRKYENSDGFALALVNGNAHRHRKSQLNSVMLEIIGNAIRTIYLTKAKHSLRHTLDVIHSQARSLVTAGRLQEADSKISLSTLSRRVAEIDRYRVIAARESRDRARMVTRTTMNGTVARYPLDFVEVDHTPLNWVVICDRTGLPLGRPLLTVLIDSYSNYILGMYVSFYGAGLSSISGALRCAIAPKADLVSGIKLEHAWIAHGIPDTLIVDNGLEFHSPVFQRMGWDLGSDFIYCRVRTPWLKPHVERFFGSLDTLTLARGRINKRVANVVNIDPDKDAVVLFSDLVKGLIMYVVDYHPFNINERKLARPYDLMKDGLELVPPARFPGSMSQLTLASALSKQLIVHQGGVELHGLPYGGAELLPLRDAFGGNFKTLIKWDPDNMANIWIQDPKGKDWIQSSCRWYDYSADLTWNQHLQIRKFARNEFNDNRSYEYLAKARLRLHEHWTNSINWKNRTDQKLAAKISGASSSKVLNGSGPTVQPTPAMLISREEIQGMPAFQPDDFEVINYMQP